jgi:SAM-dependent methyltransferase
MEGSKIKDVTKSGVSYELELVSCNLCKGDKLNVLYKKPDIKLFLSDYEFNVVQCKECGLIFLNPRPTIESAEIFYPKRYFEQLNQEGQSSKSRRYENETRYLMGVRPGKILDIGCAGGGFLRLLRERGWDVHGMDLSDSAGNDYNIDIKYGSLEKLNLPSQSFDVVTAWAVLEHLHDPMSYFKEAFRLLKSSGRFIFLVPNVNSLWSRLGYSDDIPRHQYFYSEKTIKQYAKTCGFDLDSIDFCNDIYSGHRKDVFRIKFLRWLGVPWVDLYKRQRKPIFRLVGIIGSLLGITLIHPSIEIFFRLSGTMVVTLKKK